MPRRRFTLFNLAITNPFFFQFCLYFNYFYLFSALCNTYSTKTTLFPYTSLLWIRQTRRYNSTIIKEESRDHFLSSTVVRYSYFETSYSGMCTCSHQAIFWRRCRGAKRLLSFVSCCLFYYCAKLSTGS